KSPSYTKSVSWQHYRLRHYYSAVITGEKCGDFQR
ncbi:transposase, partial [Escherichia coli]